MCSAAAAAEPAPRGPPRQCECIESPSQESEARRGPPSDACLGKSIAFFRVKGAPSSVISRQGPPWIPRSPKGSPPQNRADLSLISPEGSTPSPNTIPDSPKTSAHHLPPRLVLSKALLGKGSTLVPWGRVPTLTVLPPPKGCGPMSPRPSSNSEGPTSPAWVPRPAPTPALDPH